MEDKYGNLVDNAYTVSKWGVGAIYSTKSADPYSTLCAYGRCVMVCYKK